MKMYYFMLRKLTVLFWVVWCSLVVALPPKKIFVTTGTVDNGVTAKPLLSLGLGPFSLQLGLQQWAQQPSGPMTQVCCMSGTTNITLPSVTLLVPNAVLNVSGLLPLPGPVPSPTPGPAPAPAPGPVPAPPTNLPFPWETTTSVILPPPGQPVLPPGQQPGDQGGFVIVTETVDSMGNVMQTIQPIGSVPVGGQGGQQVVTFLPGPPGTTVVEEIIQQPGSSGTTIFEEIIEGPGQPIQPGTGIIRKGVITRLTGAVLQRNNTKPIINFIKGH